MQVLRLTLKTKDGWTPLHYAAAFNSNPDVVKALISAGAKVNAKDKDGWTPLRAAAIKNSNPDVVKALISAGAKAKDKYGYSFAYLQHTTQTQM